MITEIKPIATVEELYNRKGEPTGEMIVDATVWAIMHSHTREAQDIASMVNADQRKLTHAIELLVGESLKDFIDEWRMLQARDLCVNTELPLHKVASLCGFGCYKSLIFACKRRWKTTPFALRTGTLFRNGNYKLNQDSNTRKELLKQANELRQN